MVYSISGISVICFGRFLKDPEISGNAIYYLAAAPEMADVSGRFFNLTIDEKPAPHALDRSWVKRVWNISES